jgi:small redox-active disulfide protein 2
MKIQVFGSGCKKCKELHERVQKAVQLSGIDGSVEYVTDVREMVQIGIMSSPALVINGVPVLSGALPSIERVVEILEGSTIK